MSDLVMNQDAASDQGRASGEACRLITSDFERLYRGIHRYLLHRFFDRELAEELTAETFYRMAASVGTFRGNAGQLEAWLFRTATNLANTHLRRMRVRRLVFGRWGRLQPDTSEASGATEPDEVERTRVRRALADLPFKYQTVVVLRYYAQMSFEEIAAVVNCRPGTVRARLSRGLRKLRERLTGGGR